MRAMHAANRLAWDEAAERYEGWFDEAVELIRSGGSNLYPVEHDLIGDLRGRCRRAIHLQCAGGRDTLSLWNLGADEVVGVDFSPRMLDLARRLTTPRARRQPGSRRTSSTSPTSSTAPRTSSTRAAAPIIWLQDLDAWAAVLRRLLAPGGRLVIFDGHPAEWLFDGDGEWRLDAHRLRLLRRSRGVAGLGTGVHRPPVHPGRTSSTGSSPGPGPSARSSRRCWAPACASSAWRSTRWTGGPATATSDPTSAVACPCRSPSWRRVGCDQPRIQFVPHARHATSGAVRSDHGELTRH